jgi:hypothetical protein
MNPLLVARILTQLRLLRSLFNAQQDCARWRLTDRCKVPPLNKIYLVPFENQFFVFQIPDGGILGGFYESTVAEIFCRGYAVKVNLEFEFFGRRLLSGEDSNYYQLSNLT